MSIRDIMSRDIAAVDVESTLLDAAVKMKLYDIGMVIVSERGRMVGVVTDRDVVVRGVAEGADPTFFTVKRLMTTRVVTCSEGESIERAAELMRAEQVRRLIVVDVRGEPVGVLSIGDLAQRAGDIELVGRVLEGITLPAAMEEVRPHQEG